ncbi:hypothetical protein HHX47_DHR1000333 [Lentinula edodes]|nr:hypothetical protein HHX47_DHR1000333 [Lentinula edodes]
MSLAASTASSFDCEDVAMEDRAMAGRFDFGQFRGQRESRGGVAEGGNGDLVDSIRDAVSSVLGDFNLSQFDLVYPQSEPEPATEDADDEPDFDDFDLVYPETPPASPPPLLAPGISEAPLPSEESAEPPVSQPESIQARLLIRLPSRKALQSPTKQPPTNNRPASPEPAVFTAPSASQNLFVSTPLPPTGTLAAHQPLQKLQADILPPRVPRITSLRLCSNPGCNGVVRVDGTRRRCMGCIMRGWTSGNYVPPAESVKKTAQVAQKRKSSESSKKRVSWFDGYGKDERESQDAMDVDEDEEIQVVSTETDNDALGADVLIRGWDSDLTESDEDDFNLNSMLANEPDLSADCNAKVQSKNQLGSYALHDPAGLVTVGARICTIRGCKHIVPNKVEYKFKLCFPCRIRSARSARIRQARVEQSKAMSSLVTEVEVPVEKAFPLVDVPPPQNPLRAAVGRCASMDCGLKLEPSKLKSFQTKAKNRLNVTDMEMLPSLSSPDPGATGELGETENVETNDSEALCDQCTWRRLPPDVRRSRKVEVHRRVRIILDCERDSTKLHTDGGGPSQLKPCIRPNVPVIKLPQRPIPPPKVCFYRTLIRFLIDLDICSILQPRNPTPYPEYQSISHLICDLQSLFKSFIQAQGFYLAFSLTCKQNSTASTGHTNKPSEPPHVLNSEAPFSDTTSTNAIHPCNSFNSSKFSNNPSSLSASKLNPIIPRTMSKFAFDGEFSIVAPDFELLERKDEVNEFVTSAMHQIEKVASVKFL